MPYSHRLSRFLTVPLILISLLVTSTPPTVYAATFTPGCTAGVGDATALASAVSNANSNTQDDTITLVSGCTYALPSTLSISADAANTLTINTDGGGSATLQGNGSFILVNVLSGADVSLNNLTLTNGFAVNGAGAIANSGALTITNSTLDGNTANNGAGGVVNNSGATLNLTLVTLSNNQGTTGGAIDNEGGAIIIDRTTFSGNSGSGVIFNNLGTVTLNNSIITSNPTSAGIVNNASAIVTLNNSTVSGNGLGVNNAFGSLIVNNTILANNTSGDCQNGGSLSVNYSLIEDGSCIGGLSSSTPDANGNLMGDPGLDGALVPDPGLYTPTANRVIDRGNPNTGTGFDCLATDALGNTRNDGDGDSIVRCDMGAFEAPAALTAVSITGGGTVSEGSNTTFTITWGGGILGSPLTINLTLTSGTALNAADYALSGGSISGQSGSVTVVIPSGADHVDVTFAAAGDGGSAEANETLTAALAAGSGYSIAAAAPSVDVTIAANGLLVTNGNDSGEGSMRQAVLNANADGVNSAISFSGVSTVSLTSGTLNLVNNGTITINGGAGVTVQGNGGFALMNIAAGTVASLDNLTLTNGFAVNGAGAIANSGALTITNSTLNGNTANNGAGGVVNNSGATLNLTLVTLSNNQGTTGGAIDNEGGTIIIDRTTFSGNSGSGVIFNNLGTVTLNNSIITSNPTSAGIVNNASAIVTLNNSTVSGNGLGVNNAFGSLTVNNTILANNTSGDCQNGGSLSVNYSLVKDGSCGVTNGVNGNLTGDPNLNVSLIPNATSPVINAGNDALIPVGVTTDIAGNVRSQGGAVDIGAYETTVTMVTVAGGGTVSEGSTATITIARPGDTSGPLTVNLLLTPGTALNATDYTLRDPSLNDITTSVIIPAGANHVDVTFTAVNDGSSAEADETLTIALQSGSGYTLGATVSTGATILANGLVVTNVNDSGEGSLRQAITNANAFPSSDTITFTTSGTITLASNLPDLANNGTLTIDGGGVITLVPVSATGYRVFTLASGAQVTLNGLAMSVTINTYNPSGGLIYVDSGALTVTNSSFTKGRSDSGGAIYNNSATVIITGSGFYNNTAVNGGSIYNQSGQVSVTASTFDFSLSIAALSGGAIYNSTGTVTVTNSTIRNLGSASEGGGIYNTGTLYVYDTTFADNHPNTATLAADLFNGGTATVYNSILANQVRGLNCKNSGTITIQNTLIEDGSCGITNGTNGNLTGDPSLGTFSGVYYPLNSGSSAINAGDNSLIPGGVTTDQAGNARIQGGTVDMGAFESAFVPVVSVTASQPNASEIGPATGTFTLTRTGGLSALTVTFSIGGTATQGTDYTLTDPSANTLTTTVDFPAGVSSVDVTVNPLADGAVEGNETVVLTLVDGADYDLGGGASGTVTIADAPTLSINNVSLSEGNSGTTSFIFTVSLSAPATQIVSFDYATTDNTATTAASDYAPAASSGFIAVGSSSTTISVTVNGDTQFEANETFFVTLSNVVNAGLLNAQGTGTIVNDDTPPHVFINDVTLNEGNAGTTSYTFDVTLDAPAGVVATVDYATADSTAAQPSDYTAASGTVTFAPGETSHQITVLVNGDTAFENNETFTVNLLNLINLISGDIQGAGAIVNDDVPPAISINDVTQSEGNSGTTSFTFTVSLNTASGKSTFVDFAVADGTATAGSDYTDSSLIHTLLFPAGTTTQTITIDVNGDTTAETDETFFVNLSNPVNATISDTQGLGTLLND
ncbi:MAG: Calx-beta domain-containing protein [Anaerolineae bacterium]